MQSYEAYYLYVLARSMQSYIPLNICICSGGISVWKTVKKAFIWIVSSLTAIHQYFTNLLQKNKTCCIILYTFNKVFSSSSSLSFCISRYKYFPNRSGGMSGFGQAPSTRRRPNDDNQGGHNWGRGGHVLGDNWGERVQLSAYRIFHASFWS